MNDWRLCKTGGLHARNKDERHPCVMDERHSCAMDERHSCAMDERHSCRIT